MSRHVVTGATSGSGTCGSACWEVCGCPVVQGARAPTKKRRKTASVARKEALTHLHLDVADRDRVVRRGGIHRIEVVICGAAAVLLVSACSRTLGGPKAGLGPGERMCRMHTSSARIGTFYTPGRM